MLLHRERPIQAAGSHLEIEMTLDFGPLQGRPRHECFAPWRPPIEVFETKTDLVVRAEIGGISPGEVKVLIAGDTLRIRGERTVSRTPDRRLYHESRVRYGPFEATVRLPFPVEIDEATANYADGFLSIYLPRLAATKVSAREANPRDESQRGER